MESDSEYLTMTPELSEDCTSTLLPVKSREKYEKRYDLFMAWCKDKEITEITESVLLDYFSEQSKICNPAYLWTMYSMLKSTIKIKNNIDIKNFKKLIAFLKHANVGYKPKKSKTLTSAQVNKFLQEAPDNQYLMEKVVLILGISGACRMDELLKMSPRDIEDEGSILVVTIPDTKLSKGRVFIVTNGTQQEIDYLAIYRKYLSLRPKTNTSNRLFISYKNGKCINQVVGKNTLGKVPKEIADYLKLPQSDLYTGHCLRKTSATLLNGRGNVTQLNQDGAWKSSSTTESCVEESVSDKIKAAREILDKTSHTVPPEQTSNLSNTSISLNRFLTQSQLASAPATVFQNCDNCTITINNYILK